MPECFLLGLKPLFKGSLISIFKTHTFIYNFCWKQENILPCTELVSCHLLRPRVRNWKIFMDTSEIFWLSGEAPRHASSLLHSRHGVTASTTLHTAAAKHVKCPPALISICYKHHSQSIVFYTFKISKTQMFPKYEYFQNIHVRSGSCD